MVNIDDNAIIIQYLYQGSQYKWRSTPLKDFHVLNGYYSKNNIPLIVTSLTIGKNLSCHGMIMTTINNENLMNYQHFGPGNYEFKTPIVFLTYHINKIV